MSLPPRDPNNYVTLHFSEPQSSRAPPSRLRVKRSTLRKITLKYVRTKLNPLYLCRNGGRLIADWTMPVATPRRLVYTHHINAGWRPSTLPFSRWLQRLQSHLILIFFRINIWAEIWCVYRSLNTCSVYGSELYIWWFGLKNASA